MSTFCAYHGRLLLTIMLCHLIAGCGGGYRLQKSIGGETLFHVARNGHIRIICQVEDGRLTVHDRNDPKARQFIARYHNPGHDRLSTHFTPRSHPTAAQTARIRKIKTAPKRKAADPIYVCVHPPQLGPQLTGNAEETEITRARIKAIVAKAMNTDHIIYVTSGRADVEIFSNSYFKKARAFNTQTRKMVVMDAFHFEIDVHSNYLPQDSFRVVEAGHWMENEWVIGRAADRINKVIKKKIGPNIPADREKFLTVTEPKIGQPQV